MAYMMEIIHLPLPDDDLAAAELLDGEPGPAVGVATPGRLPPRVQELYRRLTVRFPCIATDPDGPWSDGPLINNFSPSLTVLGVSYSRVAEVLPFLVRTAHELGFTVFDPQEERFLRPGQPPGRPLAELAAARDAATLRRPWWRFWA